MVIRLRELVSDPGPAYACCRHPATSSNITNCKATPQPSSAACLFMRPASTTGLGHAQVGDARRLLKSLQALEAALPAADRTSGGAGALPALQSRLEAAELAGVAPHHPLLAAGHAAARRFALADASRELRLAAEELARQRGDRWVPPAQTQELRVGSNYDLVRIRLMARRRHGDQALGSLVQALGVDAACGMMANRTPLQHVRSNGCRSRADEAKQARALVERVRLLLSSGGALARQGSARMSRPTRQPEAVDSEPGPDDRCSSDDSWEVVEAYPAADTIAASAAAEEAEVSRLVKGADFAIKVHLSVASQSFRHMPQALTARPCKSP